LSSTSDVLFLKWENAFDNWQQLKSTPIPILTPCGGWVKVEDGLPEVKGFYTVRGLNNQGNPVTHEGKDKIWFTGTWWVVREGCQVNEWLDESLPCQHKIENEELKKRISELEEGIRKMGSIHPDGNPQKVIDLAKQLLK